MDELQKLIYGERFKTAFHSKGGTEFQDWFVKIAGFAYGPDFEEVRPYGNKGDFKCDGRKISTGSIFQCYAPHILKDVDTIEKVKADFKGALSHWGASMKQWIFVHNDSRGLPATVVQCLDQLRNTHKNIVIETWSEPEIRELVMGLSLNQLQDLFGLAPSLPVFNQIGFEELKPVVDAIAQKEPDPASSPLTPPSPEKLEKNDLSPDAAGLLKVGRRKERLVEDFFGKTIHPDLGEKIAEAFRNRYLELKTMELTSDRIFGYLQDFAGMTGEPKQQGAALAVLSYFFERCDIFEDPNIEAVTG
ncbi:MAG: hypothetical protein HQL69_20785 [Magnetococcales bacterium]|nr:hypothetical protein [Magnetococcales bacterium]